MANGTRCDNCGARQSVAGATHCAFCGALLPDATRPRPQGPFGDVESRFAALREHRGFERMLRERPPAGAALWPGVSLAAFGVLFVGMALVVSSRPRRLGGDVVLGFLPLLFIIVGAGFVAYGAYRIVRFRRAPWDTFPGLVVGARTHVSGGGRNGTARSAYFVTVEREGGRRHEYRTTGNMAGGLSPGDMGVAHARDGMLLGFRRLRV